MNNLIGLNINYLRKGKKMSQEELGELIQVQKAQVSSYERGKSLPPADKIILLAQYFGVNIDDLLLRDFAREGMPKPGEAPREPAPGSEEEEAINKLVEVLEKQVARYERVIKEKHPDTARDLGLE